MSNDTPPESIEKPFGAANDEARLMKLEALKHEHQDLDAAIVSLQETAPYDQLTLMRLKKRKLSIKDEITKLQDDVTPDIIA
ncbi:MAG: DUF465 domain-containing protein [Pseudomonadota bacterium]